MKRYIALTLGILGLGGCAQANRAGDLLLSPPLDILEALRTVCFWLGNVVIQFVASLAGSIF